GRPQVHPAARGHTARKRHRDIACASRASLTPVSHIPASAYCRAGALRPQCPDPLRGTGGSNRRLDPRVRLHQPHPGRWRPRRHRQPWPLARRSQAGPERGADHRARAPNASPTSGLHPCRQPRGPLGQLGRGPLRIELGELQADGFDLAL
ncbi:MAG: DNA modification methylase, partial [uncultured Craurococcus sp.]